jgi:hypothetical protein
MRRFVDEKGTAWDAAIGRESWGTFVILFTPADGDPPRTAPLGSENMLEAQRELDGLSETELCARLATSQPWG